MAVSRLLAACLVVLFIVFEISFLTYLLGMDPVSNVFTFHYLRVNLAQARPGQFNFSSSAFEFWVLGIFRSSLVLGCLLGIIINVEKGPKRASKITFLIGTLSMFITIFSPIKLLAFAEITDNFAQWRFWLLFSWNIIGAILLYIVWKILTKVKSLKVEVESSSESAILIENDRMENGTIVSENKKEKKKEEPEITRRESFYLLFQLLSYCKSEWLWYLIGFSSLFLYSGARIFVPFYTGQIISDIVLTHSYEKLLHSLFILGLLSLVSATFGGMRGGCFRYAICKINREVRCNLFRSLIHQEIGFFDTTKTGEMVSRLTADCQTMSDTVALNINVFLRNLVMFIGGLVFMFKMSWQMSLITFIAMPLITIISKIYGNYYDKLSEETQETIAKANEVADEVLGSMRTVRSFANESGESGRYRERLNATLAVNVKQTYAYIGYIWINELLDLGLLIAALWYGGHLVINGRMSGAHLISFLLYQIQLGENLQGMGAVYTGLMQSVGASRKVFDYMERAPQIPNDGSHTNSELNGKVEFKDACLSYPSRPDSQVLKKISFTIDPGETVALVGPSGGGKSSCISLLEHFYEPNSGSVLLDGVRIGDYDHKFLHQKISLVSQEPVLYGRSIKDNISYGLEGMSDADIEVVAKLANAHEFICEMSDKYDTQVGEKGVQLSGGQKQRIAIARCLIRKPKVLLLDEATSALDAESEHLVQEAIYRNLAGHTVLLIAHRLSTVERADRIVVINNGQVVQQGKHESLLTQDGQYRNLVQRQLLGSHLPPSDKSISPDKKSTASDVFESPLSGSYKSVSPLSGSLSSNNSINA